MIAPFIRRGLLPAGIHPANWPDFVRRFGTTERRRQLLVGLAEALAALQEAGCALVYVDGSFVTEKPEPGDFDACWSVEGVSPDLLDPVFLDFSDGRAAQKARFGGELFPAQLPEGLSGRTFLEFFQTDRETGQAKGIVVLRLDEIDFTDLITVQREEA